MRGTLILAGVCLALLLGGGGARAQEPGEDFVVRPADDTPKVLPNLVQAGPRGDKTLGKASAPVTLIEYASLTCPICRAFHVDILPKLKADYIDKGRVFFIYREYPIGRAAAAATLAARCVPDNKFFVVTDQLFAQQAKWVAQEVQPDALYAVVKSSGLKRPSFDACLADTALSDDLAVVKARGRALGVTGTPMLFINGKAVRGGMTYEALRVLLDEAGAVATPSPAATAAPAR